VLLGWRLVPAREKASTEGFETGAYVTEVRVVPDSKAAGMLLREIETRLDEAGAQIIGLVRNEVRMTAPQSSRKVLADDILVIEADIEALPEVLATLGLKLEEAGSSRMGDEPDEDADEQQLTPAAKPAQATPDAPQARRKKQDASKEGGRQDAGGGRREGDEARKNKDEDASDGRDGNDSD